MKENTISIALVKTKIEGAQNAGLDVKQMLRKYHIDLSSLNHPQILKSKRISIEDFAGLGLDIMTALDDEMLGLIDKKNHMGTFNMMCRSCITASTLKKSLTRAANYWNLFDNSFLHQVHIGNNTSHYVITRKPGSQVLNQYAIELMLSTIHRYHCWVTGQFIPLKKLTLDYNQPEYSEEYRQLFYNAPIDYNCRSSSIEFDSSYLNIEIVKSPQALDQYLQNVELSLLLQKKSVRGSDKLVKEWLEKNISSGNNEATLKRAANHLQMSQQVLHRRLQNKGTSFKEIKMKVRRDLAIDLVFSKKYKIEEIAAMVGFSEPSAFIRAFKKWTGTTPLKYRQTHLALENT